MTQNNRDDRRREKEEKQPADETRYRFTAGACFARRNRPRARRRHPCNSSREAGPAELAKLGILWNRFRAVRAGLHLSLFSGELHLHELIDDYRSVGAEYSTGLPKLARSTAPIGRRLPRETTILLERFFEAGAGAKAV